MKKKLRNIGIAYQIMVFLFLLWRYVRKTYHQAVDDVSPCIPRTFLTRNPLFHNKHAEAMFFLFLELKIAS